MQPTVVDVDGRGPAGVPSTTTDHRLDISPASDNNGPRIEDKRRHVDSVVFSLHVENSRPPCNFGWT